MQNTRVVGAISDGVDRAQDGPVERKIRLGDNAEQIDEVIEDDENQITINSVNVQSRVITMHSGAVDQVRGERKDS